LPVECRVLSGRVLCDKLITRPEESYRLWCVVVCDLETSRIGAPRIYDISNLRVKILPCSWEDVFMTSRIIHYKLKSREVEVHELV
jgi:hypothetical protein